MQIQVKSFNALDLWNGSYRATLLNPEILPGANPVFIEESLADSDYSGMFTRDVRGLVLQVRIKDYANRESLRAQLMATFKSGTHSDLVVTFAVDGMDYSLPATVQAAPVDPDGSGRYTVILQSEATAWRAGTPDTDTWNLGGAGGTHTVTVEGDDETRLSVTFTPSVAPLGGYLHQGLYRLVPPNGVKVGLRPWCITLDTAALVAAGKLRADCADLRVWDGDREIRRWIDSPNTDHTKIWFNVNERKGVRLTLHVAVAGAGTILYLKFKQDATHQARIKSLPAAGIVYHGTEWFSYMARDAVKCQLTVGERGLFNTALQAHNAGDSFDFIPAAIRLVYDNAGATDPALDDDDYDSTKPLFNLNQSDNTKWVWTASDLFYDPDHPDRPGSWVQALQAVGNVSHLYWIKQDAETGDPAIGAQLAAWKSGSAWKAETATAAWIFKDAVGISKITVTGQKYRNTGKWPDTAAGIERSPNGVQWYTVFNEATPASAGVWTNLTNNGVANVIDGATKQVRVIFSEVLAALANAYAMFEILTCTVEFTSANLPSGTQLGEQLNYPLELTLTNNATGESISLKYPMRMDQDLVLNGESNQLTYQGLSAHNALSLDDEGRSIWLRLVKGDNELEITGADLGALAAALSWYRRRL